MNIDECRQQIDSLDRQIVDALNRRLGDVLHLLVCEAACGDCASDMDGLHHGVNGVVTTQQGGGL